MALEYPVLYRFWLRNAQETSRNLQDKGLDKTANLNPLTEILHAENSNYHPSQTGLSRPDLVGRIASIASRTKREETYFRHNGHTSSKASLDHECMSSGELGALSSESRNWGVAIAS